MTTRVVSPERIVAEQQRLLGSLQELTGQTRGDDATLNLPGTEIVLRFLAEKIVLSILMSFVNRVLYDKYKNFQTAREAAEIQSSIIQLGLNPTTAVPSEELESDLRKVCKQHGLTD